MFDRPTAISNQRASRVIDAGYAPPTADYPASAIPPPPREVGEVTNEGRQMDKALMVLSEEIDMLESALGLVLRPDMGACGEGSATPEPLRSGVAQGLAEANRRISSMASRLRAVRSRVDL